MASWGYPSGAASGHYGQQSYGNYPSAPGMGAPPVMPPGMGAPPGMPPPGTNEAQSPAPGRAGALPPNFKPPVNMPNINFSAPVIRLGTTGPAARDAPSRNRDSNAEPVSSRRGLGMTRDGDARQSARDRESMLLIPPTREEIARTIWVGNITDGCGGDGGLDRLLRTAGNLRRWTRAFDADNKPMTFGFAEYEDAESLETAIEIFKDIEVPTSKFDPAKAQDGEEIEKIKLLVVVAEESRKYAVDWRERRMRQGEDETTAQFRIDSAKEALDSVLASLFNPIARDQDGDTTMQEVETTQDPTTGEFVPLSVAEPEDELSDIPADMREQVAAEIAAFRERSNKRDMERLKREEEIEAQFAQRRAQGSTSVMLSAANGPAGGVNGVPLGPKGRGIGVEGAPLGPKSQMPSDYREPGRFINGSGREPSIWDYISKSDEDNSDLDDWELEQRRREKKKREQEKVFKNQLQRWIARERSQADSLKRIADFEKREAQDFEKAKQKMAKLLKLWDDDMEASNTKDLYYADHSAWREHRTEALRREERADDEDRAAEEHEKSIERQKEEKARGLADKFLTEEMGDALPEEAPKAAPKEPTRLKFSMGALVAPSALAAAERKRKTAFEIEGLLEEEEDIATGPVRKRRELIPLKLDAIDNFRHPTTEESEEAVTQLAKQIPTDAEGLFKWDVAWDQLSEDLIEDPLLPFVEKRFVQMLGVQEQMLIDEVIGHVRKHSSPQTVINELDGLLDKEEALDFVRKLWRMVIYLTEKEKRGL